MTANDTYTASRGFEQYYFALRQKEGRLYSDEEISQLPVIRKEHPHYKEWLVRKESGDRLFHYLEKKSPPLNILDVGCGNGWLAGRLAGLTDAIVTGIDNDSAELRQGARVFKNVPNLKFIPGDFRQGAITNTDHDIIVFAASIQYFNPVHDCINKAMALLKPGGEIHIIDSPFYSTAGVSAARSRTTTYYTEIGFPEMTAYYFHHTIDDLKPFHPEIMYKQSFINQYVLNNKNPFPWLCIKKQ